MAGALPVADDLPCRGALRSRLKECSPRSSLGRRCCHGFCRCVRTDAVEGSAGSLGWQTSAVPRDRG